MVIFNCILQGPVMAREHNKFICFQKCLQGEGNIRKNTETSEEP